MLSFSSPAASAPPHAPYQTSRGVICAARQPSAVSCCQASAVSSADGGSAAAPAGG